MPTSYISVIILTFNQADNVLPMARRIRSFLSRFQWERLFIDDNSTDSSGVAVLFATLCTAPKASGRSAFAQARSTILGATRSYVFYNILTFRDRVLRGRHSLVGYVMFMLAASVGIHTNVSAIDVQLYRLTDVVFVVALAGILINTLWKFVFSNRFIWR